MRRIARRSVLACFASGCGAKFAAGQNRSTAENLFELGLYQLPPGEKGFQRAGDAGFTLVRTAPRTEMLDQAHRHGMKAWCAVGSIHPQNQSGDEARVREIVNTLKSHPALAYWETEDEPSYVWNKPAAVRIAPEVITATARFIRSIDSQHSIYLNHPPANLVSTLQRYSEGADIIATDIYPVIPHGIRTQYGLWADGHHGDFADTSLSQVGRYADKMREVAGPKRRVFLILQGFAWENGRKPNDRDPRMILYPTYAQLRFMAFHAIIHGVNGLIFWGLHLNPAAAPIWTDVARVAKEVASLREPLARTPVESKLRFQYHDTGHSLDRGIEWTLRPSSNGVLLIAANADKNPVSATVQNLDRFSSIAPVGSDRPLRDLRLTFAPYEVQVLRLW